MTPTRRLLLVAGMLGFAGRAWAHAFPRTTRPAAGSVLAVAPAEVVIVFSERLEAQFSTIEVRDRADRKVTDAAAVLDAGDARRLGLALPQLPAGTYRVRWRAVSVDTHRTEGAYDFTIAP